MTVNISNILLGQLNKRSIASITDSISYPPFMSKVRQSGHYGTIRKPSGYSWMTDSLVDVNQGQYSLV